jgi:hypothetical protein
MRELVKRMQWCPLDVLGQRVLLGQTFRAHDTRDRCRAAETFLLDQKLERAIAAAAGRHFEHAGLGTLLVKNRSHGEALQKCAARDIGRQLLDRDPAFTRRTFAWLSTRRLKGMSRDWLSVIF